MPDSRAAVAAKQLSTPSGSNPSWVENYHIGDQNLPDRQRAPLRKIATHMGVSGSWLRHLFTEALGISPHRWVLHRRVEAARDLLGRTELSIKEVAFQVGFGSPAHFTYMFRRHVGLPPRQYRRTIVPRQESDNPQQDHDDN